MKAGDKNLEQTITVKGMMPLNEIVKKGRIESSFRTKTICPGSLIFLSS